MAKFHGDNEYWQLENYIDTNANGLKRLLAPKGYAVDGSMTKPELVLLKQRDDCNLINYDKCTEIELRQFATARHIRLGQANDRKAIVKLLIARDHFGTFKKFQHLPAELRNRIYVFYISGMPEVLTRPSLPPLAQTCKLLRDEVRPVFCNLKTMHFIFDCDAPPLLRILSVSVVSSRPRLAPPDLYAEKSGLHSFASVHITLLTRWPRPQNVMLDSLRTTGRRIKNLPTVSLRCEIDVGGSRGNKGYHLTLFGDAPIGEQARTTKWHRALEKRMHKILAKVVKRTGLNRLTLSDLNDVKFTMGETFR